LNVFPLETGAVPMRRPVRIARRITAEAI